MRKGLNKVILIGWLDGSPEMRYTPSGRPVASFSIAVPPLLGVGGGRTT